MKSKPCHTIIFSKSLYWLEPSTPTTHTQFRTGVPKVHEKLSLKETLEIHKNLLKKSTAHEVLKQFHYSKSPLDCESSLQHGTIYAIIPLSQFDLTTKHWRVQGPSQEGSVLIICSEKHQYWTLILPLKILSHQVLKSS